MCLFLCQYHSGFFSGHAHGMWKLPGQGSNPYHSSDNTVSLTARPPGKSSYCFIPVALYYSPKSGNVSSISALLSQDYFGYVGVFYVMFFYV